MSNNSEIVNYEQTITDIRRVWVKLLFKRMALRELKLFPTLALFGLRYICKRKALLGLMLFSTLINYLVITVSQFNECGQTRVSIQTLDYVENMKNTYNTFQVIVMTLEYSVLSYMI